MAYEQCPDRVIIAPADGKVVEIVHDEHAQLEEGFAYRVSIFLSPLDVHVQRTPIAGTIKKTEYRRGAFMVAYAPKSSNLNERNDIIIMSADGFTIKVRQIAGIVARRILCWVKAGEQVSAGVPFGMIRFGSRVDVFLPPSIDLAVKKGDRVVGGLTVLGRRRR